MNIGVTTDIAHGLTAADLAGVGFRTARFVLRWRDNPDHLAHFLHELQPLGVDMIGVMTSESRESPDMDIGEAAQGWLEWLTDIGVQLKWLQIGNEPDLVSGSSMTLPHDEYNRLIHGIAPVWKGHATLVGGGLASGDPTWLAGVDQAQLEVIAVHPYGQMPNAQEKWRAALPEWATPVDYFLDRYHLYTHLPLAVSEYGGRHEELHDPLWREYYVEMTQTFGDMLAQGELAFASCYGLSELMVPGMGMLTPEWSLTDAGQGMQALLFTPGL